MYNCTVICSNIIGYIIKNECVHVFYKNMHKHALIWKNPNLDQFIISKNVTPPSYINKLQLDKYVQFGY